MWGLGKRKRPWGSNNRPERALFQELAGKRGPARPSRRRVVLPALLSVLALVVVAGAYVTIAGAINTTTVFQLDGNTVDPVAGAPDDWDTLRAEAGRRSRSQGIIADGTGSTEPGMAPV